MNGKPFAVCQSRQFENLTSLLYPTLPFPYHRKGPVCSLSRNGLGLFLCLQLFDHESWSTDKTRSTRRSVCL
jgi:hypothetical protein